MALYLINSLISLIFIASLCLLFYAIYKRNLRKKVTYEAIYNYIAKNFVDYKIVQEIIPLNINKTFSLKKDGDQYILKIICKNAKRAKRETALLQELGPNVLTPKLISANVATIPGHILMSHSGINLVKSDEIKDYFNLGKVIPYISETILSKQCKRLLKKNRTERNIKKLSSKVDSSHPYAQYFYKYRHLPKNYLCHGDLHLHQALLDTHGRISIIDWESATCSYRVYDLSKALSHCLIVKPSKDYARAIMNGYKSIHKLHNEDDIKLLLSFIWYELNKKYYLWANSTQKWEQQRVKIIKSLLDDMILEEIFDLRYTV